MFRFLYTAIICFSFFSFRFWPFNYSEDYSKYCRNYQKWDKAWSKDYMQILLCRPLLIDSFFTIYASINHRIEFDFSLSSWNYKHGNCCQFTGRHIKADCPWTMGRVSHRITIQNLDLKSKHRDKGFRFIQKNQQSSKDQSRFNIHCLLLQKVNFEIHVFITAMPTADLLYNRIVKNKSSLNPFWPIKPL